MKFNSYKKTVNHKIREKFATILTGQIPRNFQRFVTNNLGICHDDETNFLSISAITVNKRITG